METNKNLKDIALSHLENKWGDAVVLTLVVYLLQIVICYPWYPMDMRIVALLLLPMSWSFCVIFLRIVREQENTRFANLFDGYRDFLRVFGTLFLQNIYVFLWALLLFVPGIVKSLSYAMTSFVLEDHPELKYNSAIERSMAMMDGYKAKLFWLQLGFIGWLLLSLLTLGIGLLWLVPYYNTTMAAFYEDRKREFEEETAEADESRDSFFPERDTEIETGEF